MPDEGQGPSRERFLIDSAARLNRVLEPKPLFEEIRDITCQALDVEACSVLLLDTALDAWCFHVAYNRLTDPTEVPPLGREQGLAGWVAKHGEAALVNDARGDNRLRHLLDKKMDFEIRSVMAVPLHRVSKVIGVLEVLNSRRPEGFSREDLGMLEALGNQFSVALANARLYEKLLREKRANELLYRVGLELSRSLRLHELLPLMAELLAEMIEFNAVGIYLHHRQSDTLEWFHGGGYPEGAEEQVRLKVGQGAVGWVAEHREALIIPDVREDKRYLAARPETRSEMSVPLMAEGEVVGVFNLESDRLRAFSQRDLRLLSAFGNQAAIAIQRAWLHNQSIEKRRLEEEVRIARRIQRRLLPAADPAFPGLDIAAFNHPSREVSGDVYDYLEIGPEQLGILIGDVSGKGIPAGIVMATFRASLRAEARNNYAISVILSKVNQLLFESIEETDFVTAVYGVFDQSLRRLTYSNAGHNPPLLLRVSGEHEWLEEGGTLLGAFPQAIYREAFVDMQIGDLLVFYTDGITEALSPEGDMFGTQRLLDVVQSSSRDETARGICSRLLEEVHDFCQKVHMEDDLTAVVLRVNEPQAQEAPADGGYR
ncbi:SpoIIE family protein phosphatase [Candidatus Eisenbacteria bacterium]|uniref:SpoIIE family protein phosphatase n=1 Tax=Eiseniibacteriota bacterium TaxID=2212470 RepID=A0ABV6YKQ0_UNCEI